LRWYVEGFVKRSDINIDMGSIQEVGRLSRDIETALFRVVQESLTNVSRHSGSGSGEIILRRQGHEIILQITDHGSGMSKAFKRETGGAESLGVGISGMRERLRQFGGVLQVEWTDFGTTVTAKVPALYEAAEASNDEGYHTPAAAQPALVKPFRKSSSQ
jgi:two-component system NarL family sensor kinase